MNKYHAYLRVSRDTQDTENQLHGINTYAGQHNITLASIIRDTASGVMRWQERGIGQMLTEDARGDTILVAEISRLARSTLQVLEIMQAAGECGITIHVIKSSLTLDGGKLGKMMAVLLGMFAELERDMIRERTTEALARRREAGLPMGRPKGEARMLKLDRMAGQIDGWLEKKINKRNIAKLAEVSPATLYSWLARRRPKPTQVDRPFPSGAL